MPNRHLPVAVNLLLVGFGMLIVACNRQLAASTGTNEFSTNLPANTSTIISTPPIITGSLVTPTTPTRAPTPTQFPEDIPPRYQDQIPTRRPTLSAVEEIANANKMATQEAVTSIQETAMAKYASEMALFPDCGAPNHHYYSPDGNWVALWCVNPITVVYNLHNNKIAWSLRYSEIFGLGKDADPFFNIIPFHWSIDNRYLFLSVLHCCLDGGCPEYLDGSALIRLDLKSGRVTQTLRPGEEFEFYSISFSQDDSYLAFLRNWIMPPVLNIVNMKTGNEQHIHLANQYLDAGAVIWSPDKSKIIFSARTGEYCDHLVYYLVMMDLATFDQTILWQGSTVGYKPIEWTVDNHVILSGYAVLDLSDLSLTQYPTPSPTSP